jgi:glyoxylase-like metal-dependent hydrolase (beta-lactamase superfamily II)
MRIHAIQTGTVAIKRRQRQGRGHGGMRLLNTLLDREWTERLPIYAWLIEHPEGIIVVDTGESARVLQPGYFPGWHPFYRYGVKFFISPEQEIGPQLRTLGLHPDDVRWVVLTHLHTDHAGGLGHFPKAEILVSRTEYTFASSFAGRMSGYLVQRWPSWFAPRLVDFASTPLGPFPQSFALTQAGDVTLIPTTGHSSGHLSVVVRDGDDTIFLAGDTSYTQQLMLEQAVDGVSPEEAAAIDTLERIKRFVLETPTVYLPSHDPDAAQRLATRIVVPTASGSAPSQPIGEAAREFAVN